MSFTQHVYILQPITDQMLLVPLEACFSFRASTSEVHNKHCKSTFSCSCVFPTLRLLGFPCWFRVKVFLQKWIYTSIRRQSETIYHLHPPEFSIIRPLSSNPAHICWDYFFLLSPATELRPFPKTYYAISAVIDPITATAV